MSHFNNIDNFLCLLKGVKALSGGEYQALCPSHNDINPSLHIKLADNKILLNCKAGCQTPDIVKELNLTMADLFIRDANVGVSPKHIKATYDYIDENRKLLYQVVRYEPKAFNQRRPDGSGGWLYNLDGVIPVLYHLPDILEAKYTTPIYIAEGEKDADNLWKWGLVATCNPMGAGKWRPQYTETLTGAVKVIIIPDRDDAGRQHAKDILKALNGKVNSIKVVEVSGDGNKDVSDFFDAGNIADDLLKLVESTPEWTEFSEYRNQLICLTGVTPVEIDWTWKPYIPRGYLILLEGDPGTGKSTVCLALATAISKGTTIMGNQFPVGNVLIMSAEDGNADVIVPRLIKMGADRARVFVPKELLTIDDNGIILLENLIRSVNPILVIIDPLVAFLEGTMDINQANQVRHSLKQLAKIAETNHISIICIRHLNKGGGKKAIYRGLGSIDFTAAARSVIYAGLNENTEETALIHIKCNLAKKGNSIGYKLDEDNALLWTGISDMRYNDTADGISTGLEDVMAWLEQELLDGERAASELLELSDKRSQSRATLNRAKKALKVNSYNKGEGGKQGAGKWYWALPTD